MADQKDQGTNPPTEKPEFLPLKKRAMAEKSLVGFHRASGSDSSDSSDDGDTIDSSSQEVKKPTLQELQIKAYCSVLQAFALETTESDKRTEIIEKLKNEWQISDEAHISFADKIQKDLSTPQERDEKEMQMVPETPLTKPATPSSTCVPKAVSSWGSVDPESLIGKWVRIRLPDEGEFEEFIIKDYDAKQGMHRLETTNSNAMETDDSPSLIDLREILCGKMEKSQTLILPRYLQLDEPCSDKNALLQSLDKDYAKIETLH